MATSPNYCSAYEYNCKVSGRLGGRQGRRVTWETRDMEVRGHLISAPELLSGQDGKQRAERMTELQERRRGLQALLNTRLSELRRVCLQEAELTGEVPNEFPLETGERPPHVRRRVGTFRHGPKTILKGEEAEAGLRKPSRKTLFSSALRRHTDQDHNHHQASKSTVHRGCHTDDTVRSESSSMSDSTGHDNDDWSETQTADTDSKLGRKLSPVEVYYEMRTRRNSLASSGSPSRSLPRSVSNLEQGRSVPATPLLARYGPTSVHVRSDIPAGPAAPKQHWSDNHQAPPQTLPPSNQDGSPPAPGHQARGNGSARRSNSSEVLLERTAADEEEVLGQGQRSAMMPPYKSSEALVDGRPRPAVSTATGAGHQRGSPEMQANGHGGEPGRARGRCVPGGGAGGGVASAGAIATGYSDILLDYVWGKQQKIQQQQLHHRHQPTQSGGTTAKARLNGYPHPQYPPPHLSGGGAPPAYCSPLMLRGNPGEPRRVKVTRTKSCGPFVPLQHDGLALSAYPDPPPPPAHLYPHGQPDRGPPQYPGGEQPGAATQSLHKALALEGLRDWYLRNALGHLGNGQGSGGGQGPGLGKGREEKGAPPRRRTVASLHGSAPHAARTLQHQQSYQGEGQHAYPAQNHAPHPHLTHSVTFHGHPLHGRSVEIPLYQDTLPSQIHELTLKEPSGDQPSPGTLV